MGFFSKWWDNQVASMDDIIRKELTDQAELIAAEMRSKTDDVTGNLDRSIRVEQGVGKKGKPVVFIKAGGDLTTRNGYDYARAVEFGTVKQVAEPFFYSTVRARQKRVQQAVHSRIKSALQTGRPK